MPGKETVELRKDLGVQIFHFGILVGMLGKLVDIIVDPALFGCKDIQCFEELIRLYNGYITLNFSDQFSDGVAAGDASTLGKPIQEFDLPVIKPEGDFVCSVFLGFLCHLGICWQLPTFV